MNRLIRLALLTLFLPISLWASQDPFTVLLDHSVFNTPQNEPYVEVYISIDAAGLNWVKEEGEFISRAEVTVLLNQGGRIVNFDKFDLSGQPISDTSEINFSIQGQRRISLPNGVYEMQVEVKDLNRPTNIVKHGGDLVEVDFVGTGIEISDLRLVDKFEERDEALSRTGLLWEPYLVPYFPTQRTQLKFYAEIYGLGAEYLNEDILVVYSILPKTGDQPLTGMRAFHKQKGQDVNVVLGSLKISDLPTGEYRLRLQVRDRTNVLLAETTMPIFRSNKLGIKEFGNLAFVDVSNTFVANYTDEQVAYYLNSLKPIASNKEMEAIETLLASEKPELNRQFFFNFWVERDPNDPSKPWKHYEVAVAYVDDQYRTMNREGFETDRGRVYLQYGPPNELLRSGFESSATPHEIWQYNKVPNGETNVFFVFYNPDLISNDYRLLHANVTGEIRNDRWRTILDSKFGTDPNLDNNRIRDTYGTQIADPFQDQR